MVTTYWTDLAGQSLRSGDQGHHQTYPSHRTSTGMFWESSVLFGLSIVLFVIMAVVGGYIFFTILNRER